MNDLFVQKIMINWEHISPGSYLRGIESITKIKEMKIESPVTFFVGENGSGKSTLLEAIAISCGFNPEGGSRVTVYYSIPFTNITGNSRSGYYFL